MKPLKVEEASVGAPHEPTLSDYTTIKSYEDAVVALAKDNQEIFDLSVFNNGFLPVQTVFLIRLETISYALRYAQGWKPSNDKPFYYPRFSVVNGKLEFSRASLEEAPHTDFMPINMRLGQPTYEQAEYFGTQFLDYWKLYLRIN